jgi:NAD(P)-dependent dehydrogenase (short-subunit alcohol dehydrogenase family)
MGAMSGRLAGRTAIVTGAAGGIGSATCRLFVQEGAAVLVADVDGAGAQRVAAELRAQGARAEACSVDIRDRGQVEEMAACAAEAFGRVHVLVNNAGIGVQMHFLDTPLATWQQMLDVNLTGTFICSQVVATAMARDGGGRIVNISSHAGLLAPSGRAAYAAAKGGIIAMTRVMALDLAAQRIAVNCIAPGPVDMPRLAGLHSEERRAAWQQAVPLGRYGQPGELASVILFLASDEASYVNGQTLAVDGGFTTTGLQVKQL